MSCALDLLLSLVFLRLLLQRFRLVKVREPVDFEAFELQSRFRGQLGPRGSLDVENTRISTKSENPKHPETLAKLP